MRLDKASAEWQQGLTDYLDSTFGGSSKGGTAIAPGFKNKTRYTPYVSPGSQISHIATNKGNINGQCLNT